MKRTTKAKVIALSVFGLAVGALPMSMALNAPEAKAGGIQISQGVASSAPVRPVLVRIGDVQDVEVVVAQPKARKTHRRAAKTYRCKRIPLAQHRPAKAAPASSARPTGQSVLYCDRM